MGIHGKTINDRILIRTVTEVGKFVGVEFTDEQARNFINCFVAVLGKFMSYNRDRRFYMKKYIICRNKTSRCNLFNVFIHKNDKEVKHPDDLYDYYINGGNSITAFKEAVEEFAENLITAEVEQEEKINADLEKIMRMQKPTKRQKAKAKNKRKRRLKAKQKQQEEMNK